MRKLERELDLNEAKYSPRNTLDSDRENAMASNIQIGPLHGHDLQDLDDAACERAGRDRA